jgi:hypothetical protein
MHHFAVYPNFPFNGCPRIFPIAGRECMVDEMRLLLIAVLASVLTAACRGEAQKESDEKVQRETSSEINRDATDDRRRVRKLSGRLPGERVPKEPRTSTTGEVPQHILLEILEDAGRRTGEEVGTASIVRAESVVWSDGSLGCPQPDVLYTQALVPGYHVILDVDGVSLDYRVAANGRFRLCESMNLLRLPARAQPEA